MSAKPRTTDAIRDQIDRGNVGDKVDSPDPAAAPLGTDDEAAGAPPGSKRLRIAAEVTHARGLPLDGKGWLVLVLIAAVAVASGAALLLTLQ